MTRFRYFLIAALIILLIFLPNIAFFYTEYLWYQDVGALEIYLARYGWSFLLFCVGFTVSFLILYFSLKPVIGEPEIATAIPFTRAEKFLYLLRQTLKKYYRLFGLGLSLFISLIMGFEFAAQWEKFLLYLNSTASRIQVPVFKTDLSFFLFKLPLYLFLASWIRILSGASIFVVLVIYFVRSLTYTWNTFVQVFYWYRRHLFSLLGLYLGAEALNIYLKSFTVAYSQRGVVYGPGYVDVVYVIPFYKLAALAAVLLSLVMFFTAFRQLKIRTASYAVVVFLVIYFVGSKLVPGVIQSYFVAPNELKLEAPYIRNQIKMTRFAYDLDRFKERAVDYPERIDPNELNLINPAVANIRLWDNRPLYEVFNQLQSIRSYYVFNDVDIDRYDIAGEKTQVALSVREFEADNLAERAKTWVNLHLKYTHGYGAVVCSVRATTSEGLPVFYLKDIPPRAIDSVFELKYPQIYFGEKTNNYVIVKTREKEFGYPSGDKNVYESWQGSGGIKLDSYLKKLAFSIRFGALKILLTGEIKDESVILFDRNIVKRVKKIAPFLYFDNDPYPVIANGKIYWIIDAYTISDRVPFSEPYANQLNYIRNPVKAVVDAYTGEVRLYIFDASDPIIKTYRKIFPTIFATKKELPDFLKDHVRYPSDLFSIQAAMLTTYHMRDVQVFYNREDRWAIAEELYENEKLPVEPYYVMMPFEINSSTSVPEFILILPFTPYGKNNLIAWVYISSDGEHYGKGGVYKFPKGRLVYGPLQIEARINQDPGISRELTLWGQAGSSVIRGNLLVIPLSTGVIYVEPLYLKAEQGSIPELKRVIAADQEKVVMQENLGKAIAFLAGREAYEEQKPPLPQGKDLTEIRKLLLQMDEALRKGNFKEFGEIYERLKKLVGFNSSNATQGANSE
jgi:uncharacterized membrane protein (UPF0182 family)